MTCEPSPSPLEILRRALEPFAKLYEQITADHGDSWFPDDGGPMRASLSYPVATSPIRWSDFRRAREALAVGEGGNNPSSADGAAVPKSSAPDAEQAGLADLIVKLRAGPVQDGKGVVNVAETYFIMRDAAVALGARS